MHVRRLQLTGFRTYRPLDIEFPGGQILILGDNAQGKSNLLEALYLLASGKSVRAGNDGELIGWESEEPQPFARLQARVERREGPVSVETLIVGPASMPNGTRAGKRFKVNGIARRAIDFVGQLRAVLFTADDLEIVSGPPATRRAYLDTALSQLDRGYHASLQRYGRIIQQRNATLRRIKEGVASPDELSLWDDTFTREGAVLIAARQQEVSRLNELAGVAHRQLSGLETEVLTLVYEPQLGGDEWRSMLAPGATAASIQSLFATALASQRRREIAAGITLVGPHRDEVAISLNGVSLAAYGSRAQIRTATLALRLSEARLLLAAGNDPPVLLLDDIVSELDERRRASVLESISGFEQVFFTATTGLGLPEGFVSGSRVYEVSKGTLVDISG